MRDRRTKPRTLWLSGHWRIRRAAGLRDAEHERDTPVAVVIDESVELAKAYSGEVAAQFVNGVLGHIARAQV